MLSGDTLWPRAFSSPLSPGVTVTFLAVERGWALAWDSEAGCLEMHSSGSSTFPRGRCAAERGCLLGRAGHTASNFPVPGWGVGRGSALWAPGALSPGLSYLSWAPSHWPQTQNFLDALRQAPVGTRSVVPCLLCMEGSRPEAAQSSVLWPLPCRLQNP